MKSDRIKRLKHVVVADLSFERKQGLFTIYLVISFLYLLVFAQIPEPYRLIVAPFVIFSDPSVLGLFFIGGMLFLEKEQGILQSILVTPLEPMEYVIGKVASLSIISLGAGVLISLLIYGGAANYFTLSLGILLTSLFFTQIGILIACKSRTINDFFLKMIPWMLLLIAPVFLLIPFWEAAVLNLFPSVACLRLVYGSYHGNPILWVIAQVAYMVLINGRLFIYTIKQFENHIVYGGQDGQVELAQE